MNAAAACPEWTYLDSQMGEFSDGSATAPFAVEYSNGINCSWLIDHTRFGNPQSGSFIALSFSRFSTEPGVDVVEVYDGNSTHAPLLAELSGYHVPSYAPVVSTGSQMLVRFVTDSKQTGQQLGWHAKFVSIALSEPLCASVNEGHNMSLSCPDGFTIQKVQFASYGTPQGYCSNGVAGLAPNSNPHGATDGITAGAGAGGNDGTVLFNTGYCHANSSKAVVEAVCLGRSNCTLTVNDATFVGAGGEDPCAAMVDTKEGSGGSDDPNVEGSDAYPRFDRPYQAGGPSKFKAKSAFSCSRCYRAFIVY